MPRPDYENYTYIIIWEDGTCKQTSRVPQEYLEAYDDGLCSIIRINPGVCQEYTKVDPDVPGTYIDVPEL